MERKFAMTRDARLSALHRGGFGLRGRASLTATCRRVSFGGIGSDTASSSHPGRSAWRAGSRASPGERLRSHPPQDAPPPSAFRRGAPMIGLGDLRFLGSNPRSDPAIKLGRGTSAGNMRYVGYVDSEGRNHTAAFSQVGLWRKLRTILSSSQKLNSLSKASKIPSFGE